MVTVRESVKKRHNGSDISTITIHHNGSNRYGGNGYDSVRYGSFKTTKENESQGFLLSL